MTTVIGVDDACASVADHDSQRPQVGRGVFNPNTPSRSLISPTRDGGIPTVTPARVVWSAAQGRRRFREEQSSAEKGEHERPHPPDGRADQDVRRDVYAGPMSIATAREGRAMLRTCRRMERDE